MKQEQQTATQDQQQSVEVAPVHVLSLITKAEIDIQISTAKAFPRSLTLFKQKVMSMATIDADVAESCTYVVPRGGKQITGPSVRLAEMVAAAYTNLRTGARVVYQDDKKIVAQGIVHDMENNIYHTEEVERSLLQHEWIDDPANPGKRKKSGKMTTVNEDMKILAGRAACAIAYRNAIYKVVPAALIQDLYEKIQEVAKGTAETLVSRRQKRVQYFKDLGVKDEQICAALEVKAIDDIDLEKLHLLQGMVTAYKNQEASLETLFPTKDAHKAKADQATKKTEDKLRRQGSGNGIKDTEDKLKQGDQGQQQQ
jgi:hypothetical protein